jgi:hypothetical protein
MNLDKYVKGAKTPWFIAQQDHPGTDIATSLQSVSVIDLDQLLKTTAFGGQPLPVLPDSACVRMGSQKRLNFPVNCGKNA